MKILVVEDDALVSEALTAILTNQNYAVETTADGETAWDLISTYDYDLILLDVGIPKLDGISLCHQIRNQNLQVPILLLTGRDSSHDKAIGLNAGADDYLVKPFDEEELIARIHALLRRGKVSSQPVLEVRELRLDPSSCEVRYGEKILTLTPKEYSLLELFMRNSKRVFSCGMILEHLWSYEETPGEEAVRTHIKGLRHKLKAAGAASDLIETVYGIGYRLKAVAKEETTSRKSKSVHTTNQNTNQNTDQKTLTAIAGIWQKYQTRVDEQVNILIQAATALINQNLNSELRLSAQREAHTLAGSLGTFGFPEGSKIARKIEKILKSDKDLDVKDAQKLSSLVKALFTEIKQSPHSHPQEVAEIQESPNTNQQLKTVENGHTILAVDDDPKILEILHTLLSPWGLKVHTLDSPQSFWETLETVKPDLLILDVEMPELSGIELCQLVRNNSNWSDLPILFLTVHHDTDIINRVFTAGADDFVKKPIIAPELITRILNRLERSKFLRRIVQSQQKTQAALRDSQALFAGIINIADDAIISIDTNQCITLFNSGAEKIFGYKTEEVLGKKLDILIPSRFCPAHQKHVQEFAKSSSQARRMAERQEIFAQRKDGTEFPAEASISKLNLGNEVIYTVYLQDISDRKQIEKMKDEFVSVVSHELRTPLTSIHGSLGMLASGLIKSESEQGKRLLQIATDSTERLVRLINDILDIERIESGRVKMETQICDVASLITESLNVIQPLAEKAHINLAIASSPINILADPDRIIQTLTNLLSNAIKFSPAGSTVYLEVKQQENDILFTVKDNGRGIPEDKLEGIFERFQQVDASDSRRQDGTGLGLAICKSIVQQHHGKIWVESVLGEGSEFHFTIPMRKLLSAPKIQESLKANAPSVLICDDDTGTRNQLQTLLQEKGYRVFTVDSGEAAITAAANQHPDIILLDLVMPGMSGWEVMGILKQRKDTENIPIIICSCCHPRNDKQSNQNFAEWVCKPITNASLLRSLSQVLVDNG
ncbi:response regulator, partial [Calothrix sp. UHCC 0171]|uniref:response regulator n=1 Tax=Calothrix sp. UHCC 0171 TaxID=3110245 RepID=UPI002B212827